MPRRRTETTDTAPPEPAHQADADTATATEPDRLLTPRQLDELYPGVFPAQKLATWRSENRGGPEYVRIGSRIFYRQSAVQKYLDACTVTPAAKA